MNRSKERRLTVDAALLKRQSDLLSGYHDEAHESGRRSEERLLDGLQDLLERVLRELRRSGQATLVKKEKRR